jgi:hypothetical protein
MYSVFTLLTFVYAFTVYLHTERLFHIKVTQSASKLEWHTHMLFKVIVQWQRIFFSEHDNCIHLCNVIRKIL